jgi:hypothetical protein
MAITSRTQRLAHKTTENGVFEATKGRQTPWLARNALVGEMALF